MTTACTIRRSDPWRFQTEGFEPGDITLNGNRFLIGNGYLGYRGTLEEFRSPEKVGCLLNGIYDQVPGKWREPVNAPNGLYVRVDGAHEILDHSQELDLRTAVMGRSTRYATPSGPLRIATRRFASQDDVHLLCLEYTIEADSPRQVRVHTGIDTDVWDINGPHLGDPSHSTEDGIAAVVTRTKEQGITIAVAECLQCDEAPAASEFGIRVLKLDVAPGNPAVFRKIVAIFTSEDGPADPLMAAVATCRRAAGEGFERLLARHSERWDDIWQRCDVRIEGDSEAQFALRYSIYQLQIAAPRHSDRVSIPARGLSGQVYKGAVFWDTEMFMTPVFTHTEPRVARNLILYRHHTLDGARRKAAEYGFRGAFFAWESQETGDDACTHYSFTDVFTGRPMRTYFRDKQIHISGDIVHAIRRYLEITGDDSILAEGAAEVAAEIARFYFSYCVYTPDRERYELRDVTGPDEYHERVDNNAFTNRIAKSAVETAIKLLARLAGIDPAAHRSLDDRIGFSAELDRWRDMAERLHQPEPDPVSKVIPQFDGYLGLEDVPPARLKRRVLDPLEYLGGGNGIATQTQVIKQADVVLMLHLFPDDHPADVIRANWEYYEPRTEHGSSLSACAYAMVAARLGKPDRAYEYFMKTATVDLTGDSKQFVGDLYIGGTHPAANGGAWMSAVFGFAGLRIDAAGITASPSLPSHWHSVRFHVVWRGHPHQVSVSREGVSITPTEPLSR